MKQRITNISIHQTSKVIAVVYLWIGAIIAVLMLLGALGGGGAAGWSLLAAILSLILFPVMGYISTALFVYFFNKAAKMVGGIEFVLEEVETAQPQEEK